MLNVHCGMAVSVYSGSLGMGALYAELCTLYCSAFGILLLAKVVWVVFSFVTSRQWFTLGCMSCGELPYDSPSNWANTEECTRLNGFNVAFFWWLGWNHGKYGTGMWINLYTSKEFDVSWYLNWRSLIRITAPSATGLPTLSTRQSKFGR